MREGIRNFRTFFKENADLLVPPLIGGALTTETVLVWQVGRPLLGSNTNPFVHTALYNTTDILTFTLENLIYTTSSFFIKSPITRRIMSVSLATATLLACELPQVNHILHPFIQLGTPDIADIPAGVLGITSSWGISAYFENRQTRRSN